ncbi:MAG: GNAT family N-acetyltransferase [Azovibrio sp.]|nr:GNAT family N-acetyltransferase [Azovibrio sp.]
MLDSPHFSLRRMAPADLEQVLAIQAQAYPPALHETADVFAGKLRAFPASNWVVEGASGLLAYLFAQPARHCLPPPLHDPGAPVAAADALHLHDMAVRPEARGLGLARHLMRQAQAWGRQQGLGWMTLVAVGSASDFWQRLGFVPARARKSLSGYGPAALYMHRPLLG